MPALITPADRIFVADFLLETLKIQTHVIESSICIYPKYAEKPIRQEALLTGDLEPTNAWYAIAKIAGITLCRALRASVTCWGSGTPLRVFLHVDDLGETYVFTLEHWDPSAPEAPCDSTGAPLPFLNVGMSSTAKQLGHRWAVKQGQQSLERAAVVGGGVELEGKSASIKSISECIHASNALSFFSSSISLSSCFVLCSERSICISTTGSRRQLSIRKNEQKGDSDEPDAPLLLERDLSLGEGDVVIGGEERDQANNSANDGFQNCLAVKPQAPPGGRRIQILNNFIHPKQPTPLPTPTNLVHAYAIAHAGSRPGLLREHRRRRGPPRLDPARASRSASR